jgi:diadenylate cyclase
MLFEIGFVKVTWVDILDVAIVAYILYRVYLVMRGTIASQIFLGFVLIFASSFMAQALHFTAVGWLLRALTDVWVIVFIVLFQPELRRLLIIVGRSRIVRMFLKLDVDESINEVVGAVEEMAENQHGALIVFIRATGLRIFIETGIQLQARVSKQLLLSIFNPKSPLHDGAVIIKDRVIEAARCTLPLSLTTAVGGTILGMRHRAGLGVSEQADVLAVIVSEETGTISVAENGTLRRGLTPLQLADWLRSNLFVQGDKSAKSFLRAVRGQEA